MNHAIKTLSTDSSWKENLALRLRSKGEIVRFDEEPVLAALCTCAALQFEVGNPEFDRLTPFLGGQEGTEWRTDLVVKGQDVGVRIRRRDGRSLEPRHRDLCHLLDPSSLDEAGVLSQAVIFPRLVAETYRKRGVELVIVRDWILRTALHFGPFEAVGYLQTNLWEVEMGIAATQAAMLARGELAFFGTHDIVDHLFGWEGRGFQSLSPLYHRAATRLAAATKTRARSHLLLSYLVGVALDDSAQPKWYGSPEHLFTVQFLLDQLERSPVREGALSIPESFHRAAHSMRNGGPVQQSLVEFTNDCFHA
jgi:hypothetical protein